MKGSGYLHEAAEYAQQKGSQQSNENGQDGVSRRHVLDPGNIDQHGGGGGHAYRTVKEQERQKDSETRVTEATLQERGHKKQPTMDRLPSTIYDTGISESMCVLAWRAVGPHSPSRLFRKASLVAFWRRWNELFDALLDYSTRIQAVDSPANRRVESQSTIRPVLRASKEYKTSFDGPKSRV